MRYLGWGVGHCNCADFPHEAGQLSVSAHDRELADFRVPATDEEDDINHEASADYDHEHVDDDTEDVGYDD